MDSHTPGSSRSFNVKDVFVQVIRGIMNSDQADQLSLDQLKFIYAIIIQPPRMEAPSLEAMRATYSSPYEP